MENGGESNNHHSKSSQQRSSNGHISMSDDDESATSQVDSFHSPLRSDDQPENDNNCRALVLVDKYYSPVPSPKKSTISPATGGKGWRPWPHSEKPSSENLDFQSTENLDVPGVVGFNRLVREEASPEVKKMGPMVGGGGGGGGGLEEGRVDEVGGESRSRAAVASILKRSGRNVVVKKAALGVRVFEVIVCLISFSVMAADRTQGWSGDSFDRYKEYRYCVAINVIGFVYSGFQAGDLAYLLGTGKSITSHHLRYHFDFSMDQILAYLLMSASSSAATRVDDWVSNWGGDEFTRMASASIAMSFLAFVAFGFSSLLSGYNLCNQDLT